MQEYETYAGNDGRAAFQLKEERSPDGATHGGYGFVDEDGEYLMPLCRARSNQYLVSRQRDPCVIDGV